MPARVTEDVLSRIVAHKRSELEQQKVRLPLSILKDRVAARSMDRRFEKALRQEGRITVLAELKRGSPSKGTMLPDADAGEIARQFESAGAAAISVLTDEKYFSGSAEDLKQVKTSAGLPVLRKDFIVDEYQVWESAEMGADAILLMAQVLSDKELTALYDLAEELGLEALVEGHEPREIERILEAGPSVIGINNRDLTNLEVDLGTTERLMGMIPKGRTVVSQSGISTPEDVKRLAPTGIHAIQVGTSLMLSGDPNRKLRELVGNADKD